MSYRLIILVLTALSCFSTGFSQPPPPPNPAVITALRQELGAYSRQDTGRVNRLNQLAAMLGMREPAEAETLSKEARLLSEKIHYDIGIARSCKNLADVYFNTGRLNDECIQLFKTAAAKFHQHQLKDEEAIALHGIALVYSSQNRSSESLDFFLTALTITEATGDFRRTASIHNNMGRLLHSIDQKENARKHYLQAIAIGEKYRFYDVLLTAHNNMMSAFDKAEDLLAVETVLQKMLDEPAPPPVQPQLLQSLANIYVRTGRIADAEKYYHKILEHPLTRKGSPQEMMAYGNLANVHMRNGNYDKAEDFAEKALAITKATGQPRTYSSQQINLARIYAAQGKLKEAIALLEEGLMNLDHTRTSIQTLELHHKDLASLYIKNGDSLGYYKTMMSFTRKKDSVASLELQKQVADLHLKYETEKKEQQIAMLGKEKQLEAANYQRAQLNLATEKKENAIQLLASNNKLQEAKLNEQAAALQVSDQEKALGKLAAEKSILSREQLLQKSELKQQRTLSYSLIAAAILLAALAIVLFSRYRLKQKANAALNEKNNKIEVLIRELHHRVKNNLQVISSLLSLQSVKLEDRDAKEAVRQGQQRVDAMAMIHQKLYLHADLSSVDMREYMEELTTNLAASYCPGLKPTMNIAAVKLDVDTAVPLGLIANELITNSFKHAFHDHAEPALWVKLEQSSTGALLLTIRDNGPGMQSLQTNSSSFGLKLVDILTRQLKGKLEIKHNQGMEYQLMIPPGTDIKAA